MSKYYTDLIANKSSSLGGILTSLYEIWLDVCLGGETEPDSSFPVRMRD